MSGTHSAPPTDEDVLRAVERHLSERGGGPVRFGAPTAVRISWHSLLDCRIVRTTETRTESARTHKGRIDLSKRAVYTELTTHKVDPPPEPGRPRRIELVQRDSIRERACECGNGTWHCKRCEGRGDIPCDTTVVCAACRGLDPCTACEGTGRARDRASTRRGAADGTAGAPVAASSERVRCAKCRSPRTACPKCAGRARTECPKCEGRGSVPCPQCKGSGTVPHDACAGTGVLTAWTGAVIEERDRADAVTLPRKRPPRRARRRAGSAGDWRETVLTSSRADLPGDLEHEHHDAIAPRLGRTPGEVARRVTIRHLPLARLAADQDPDRVFYVFPGRYGLEVVPLPSRRRVLHASAVAVAALVVVLLVLALVL
ncbi:hypothetical protein ACFYXS_28505 [Streptomyces sp. NPDC002574]|uniref:hypothetical protein n=1 Tax=Streptomyces sp. NPDC002574 TaxID=3364652 RepID=UPI0036820207